MNSMTKNCISMQILSLSSRYQHITARVNTKDAFAKTIKHTETKQIPTLREPPNILLTL